MKQADIENWTRFHHVERMDLIIEEQARMLKFSARPFHRQAFISYLQKEFDRTWDDFKADCKD